MGIIAVLLLIFTAFSPAAQNGWKSGEIHVSGAGISNNQCWCGGGVNIASSHTMTTSTLGFFSATPVEQQPNIGVLSNSTGGSINGSIVQVTILNAGPINDNFAEIADKINKIEDILQKFGLTN